MSTYLVTGAGRGLGLEIARQLAHLEPSQVTHVFAAARGQASNALQDLIADSDGRVTHISCQVTERSSLEKAAKEVEAKLGGKGLDVLVNNVGALSVYAEGICSMPGEELLETFNTNVVSMHNATSAFMPLLKQGKKKQIFNVSTTLGSMALAPTFRFAPAPSYKISKAAVNMLSKQYALEFEHEGFTVVAITPGYLKTDLGSDQADLDVETGTKAVLELMAKTDRSMNGRFWNIHVSGWEVTEGPNHYDGAEVPW